MFLYIRWLKFRLPFLLKKQKLQMKKIIFYTLIILVLASCSSTIKLVEVPIDEQYGVQIVSIEEGEAKGTLTYNGDYWFHDFDDGLYPTVSESYLEYISKETNREQSKMLWAAHTTIFPYISSVALVYNKVENMADFEAEIRKELRKKENATRIDSERFVTESGRFKKMSYFIYDEETKIQTRHIEYLGTVKDKTFRVVFWTSDSNPLVLNDEADQIMQTLSVL